MLFYDKENFLFIFVYKPQKKKKGFRFTIYNSKRKSTEIEIAFSTLQFCPLGRNPFFHK